MVLGGLSLLKEMTPYYNMPEMSADRKHNNANQQEARNCSIVGFSHTEANCSMVGANKKNNIVYSSSMNRQDLEKLSKDELINLVMNRNHKKVPGKKVKFSISNKVKKFISKYKPSKTNNRVTYSRSI